MCDLTAPNNRSSWTTPWPIRHPAPAATGTGLAALGSRGKLMLGAGLAALAALIAALALWGNRGDYKVLYANLSDKDGGAVLAQLSQMNVPYRHADGGAAILVPADQVHDVRLKLASAGLPQGLDRRLRADGQRALRPDAVPGAPDLPARPRRRAGAFDPGAGRGAERARAPRAAERRTDFFASSRSPRPRCC